MDVLNKTPDVDVVIGHLCCYSLSFGKNDGWIIEICGDKI